MTVKLLTVHNLEFLILKGGCTGSSESTLVKIPHCWKSHVIAHMVSIVSTAHMELGYLDYPYLEHSKGEFENILVLTDHYTRYSQAKSLYENCFIHYGFPARMHSDQGANFDSKLI